MSNKLNDIDEILTFPVLPVSCRIYIFEASTIFADMSGSRMFISVIVHDNKYAPFTKDVTDQEKLEIKKLGNLCTIPYQNAL